MQPSSSQLNMIKVPMLIAGILNIINAASVALVCVVMIILAIFVTPMMLLGLLCFPIGVGTGLLGYYEIRAFRTLSQPGVDPLRHRYHIKQVAICSICSIIIGNWVSMVCGILVLTALDELKNDRALLSP